jgi:hypothetical protein
VADGPLSNLSIVCGLSAQPIPVGQTQETAKPQISVCSDRTLSSHDISNPLGRNADLFGQAVPTDAHGFQELLQKELARSNRLELVHTYLSSVVVDDLYILGTRFPADAPLIIDADAELPGSVALQCFQSISRRHPQVVQSVGDLKLPQLSPRHT